ncbi:MAG: hypothetical protein HW418_1365 [Anaerolineales bacterium]|nr:hypothetical protein [Anaerolineales bacterium]
MERQAVGEAGRSQCARSSIGLKLRPDPNAERAAVRQQGQTEGAQRARRIRDVPQLLKRLEQRSLSPRGLLQQNQIGERNRQLFQGGLDDLGEAKCFRFPARPPRPAQRREHSLAQRRRADDERSTS